jgi:flagellar biosynthesis/type III secretory pathway M-ring protein FliF/YscJ
MAAAGADAKRGDVVTVESVPFVDVDVPVATAPPPSPWSIPEPWRKHVPRVGAAVAVLAFASVALAIARRRRKRAKKEAEERQAAILATVESAPQLPHAQPIETMESLPDARAEALALASRDPATAALVLRAWLGSSSQQEAKAA